MNSGVILNQIIFLNNKLNGKLSTSIYSITSYIELDEIFFGYHPPGLFNF